MPSHLFFSSQDRLLVVAPHPDDESLATGGVLQRAVQIGAQVRVVFVSDGGNNPWPQRVLERRWRITAGDQGRWGARRRKEAINALARLGLSSDVAVFLDFPDQGSTDALLCSPTEAVEEFRRVIEPWKPTLIVGPSMHDRHPDHSALSIIISMAVERLPAEERPKQLHYLVHTRRDRQPVPWIDFRLRADEQAAKREAIECHQTQMVLSRKRFTAYAGEIERFHTPEAEDAHHPIREAFHQRGAFVVRVARPTIPFHPGELWLTSDAEGADRIHWRIPLASRSGRVTITAPKGPKRTATIREVDNDLEVRIPFGPLAAAGRLFAKIHRRVAFYDEAGWRELFLRVPVLCPDLPEASFSSCSFAASFSGGGSESSA